VDDFAIAGKYLKDVQEFQSHLSQTFKMKDLGEMNQFLGVSVQYTYEPYAKRKITLNQKGYLLQVLKRYGMENSAPYDTPVALGEKLESLEMDSPKIKDRDEYRMLVGSLMYAMVATRPDLAYAVGNLARHSHAPGEQHWKAAKRVMRYITHTIDYGISYEPTGEDDACFCVFSDADWAGDQSTRKSTSGTVVMVANGPISWFSKLQRTVALSTMEAEYVAMGQTVREVMWIKKLLVDITDGVETKTKVFCDNQGAIALTRNPENHTRAKHIDIVHHFINDEVKSGRIDLQYVRTEENIADLMTKGLGRIQHEFLLRKLNIHPVGR